LGILWMVPVHFSTKMESQKSSFGQVSRGTTLDARIRRALRRALRREGSLRGSAAEGDPGPELLGNLLPNAAAQ
jgi:hypothetical protein